MKTKKTKKMANINLSESLQNILLGIVVLLVFLSVVGIVADNVYESTAGGNLSATNLTQAQVNLIDLIPLVFVVVGIMIVVMILMAFARKT